MSAADHTNDAQFLRAGDLANPEKYWPGDAPDSQGPQGPIDVYEAASRRMRIPGTHSGVKVPHPDYPGMYAAVPEVPGEPSLRDSIKSEGVREPITLKPSNSHEGLIADGHHRIYAAADIDPDMQVPVKWNMKPDED